MKRIIVEILNEYYQKKYNKTIYEDNSILYDLYMDILAQLIKSDYNLETTRVINNNPIFNKKITNNTGIIIKKRTSNYKIMNFKDGLDYLKEKNRIDIHTYNIIYNTYLNEINNERPNALTVDVMLNDYGVSISNFVTFELKIYDMQDIKLNNSYSTNNIAKIKALMNEKGYNLIKINDTLYLNFETRTITYKKQKSGKDRYHDINSDYGKKVFDTILNYINSSELSWYRVTSTINGDILSNKVELFYPPASDFLTPHKTISFNVNTKTRNEATLTEILDKENITAKEINKIAYNFILDKIESKTPIYTPFYYDMLYYYSSYRFKHYDTPSYEKFKKDYLFNPYYNENNQLCFKVPFIYETEDKPHWYVEQEIVIDDFR